MTRINPAKRQMTVKVVYYGPGLAGKTTNLQQLHANYPRDRRGEMVQLDTETERTLFFDYFPAELGTIAGYGLKADLFTVPGQSFYNATRKAVLEAVDGVVFVADSHPSREEANLVSLENLQDNLSALGRSFGTIPTVFQWNKRDVDGALPESLLQRMLNQQGAPAIPAVAIQGIGVWETQTQILQLVVQDLRRRAREGKLHG